MQLSRQALKDRWLWSSAAAAAVLLAVHALDTLLKARSGYATADLQGLTEGWGVRRILDHWTSPPDAALAGFVLGLGFLLIPLYGAALYLGAIAARERFAPQAGMRRRIMDVMAMAPVAGALFDVCENALQLRMLIGGPTDTLAVLAAQAATAKFAGVAVGIALSLAAVAGTYVKGGKKDGGDEGD